MVAPIIWAGVAVAGLFGLGYAADRTGEAADSTAQLVKWAAVAGGLYVSYEAMKATGVLK